jgi:16S rRNA (cytidine1402-2'-O)-methyltransferase
MDLSAFTQNITQTPLEPGLYVTATPIGHAADLTLRALETLVRCDAILCEDTRVTSKLLAIYGISRPLRAYHDRNGKSARPGILKDLAAGKALALVSDAGLPLISDPGFPLVRAAQEAGIRVQVLPGANAALTALCLSGLPPDQFWFGGFLPPKSAARKRALEPLKGLGGSLIFYESPRRLGPVLSDMAQVLGDRQISICRELTKRFEEVVTGTLRDLADKYAEGPAPKGEVVLVVGPAEAGAMLDDDEIAARLAALMKDMSLKEAVAEVTAGAGRPKREVYDLALALKNEEH